MRVFLSHSSVNKDFVSKVFLELGQANSEYDEQTFFAGKFNSLVIAECMSRCEVFALFATKESLSSGYVSLEINMAMEYYARKNIKKIVVFCLGGVNPEMLPGLLGMISAVRNATSPGSCARILKADLIQLEIESSTIARPYLGREAITKNIKSKLAAPGERTPLAIAFSGVDGVGRRTLATKIIEDVYPGTGKMHPKITIGSGYDIRDIYRSLLDLTASYDKADLLKEVEKFDLSDSEDKISITCEMVSKIYKEKEIIFLIDAGGVLDDGGKISGLLGELLQRLAEKPRVRPYFALILFRTPPASKRLPAEIMQYFKVDALDLEDVKELISLHIKAREQTATSDEISRLVDITDGHPYNIQFLLRLLDTYSISSLVQDPSDLVTFKKRQGDDFVAKINLGQNHIRVISLLKTLGQTPIEIISESLDLDVVEIARALKELEEYHCIERVGSLCSINRPLKTAFERSSRFKLSSEDVNSLLEGVIKQYSCYENEDRIGVDLMSAAAKAALFLNRNDDGLEMFLLPSHAIFVARQLYDLRKFSDCARVSKKPLKTQRFLSEEAWLEAIRLHCLSQARLGDYQEFEKTVSLLNGKDSKKAQAQKYFLEGFYLRLKGEHERAVEKFRLSYKKDKKSFSTLRELSHALMVLGDMEEARRYAEEALKIAPTNPYVIDQVLALRIGARSKVNKDIVYDPEIRELLDVLERYGDEEGKSFYAIRMADIYRRSGDMQESLSFSSRACKLTPGLFSAHINEAQCLIRMNKYSQAEKRSITY